MDTRVIQLDRKYTYMISRTLDVAFNVNNTTKAIKQSLEPLVHCFVVYIFTLRTTNSSCN